MRIRKRTGEEWKVQPKHIEYEEKRQYIRTEEKIEMGLGKLRI